MTSIEARNRQKLGQQGEEHAALLLQRQGWVILDRNWRCDLGELDIVAREGEYLVVCEVKTRSNARFGGPLEAISARKVRRLRRVALRWLDQHCIHAPLIRFDLIAVTRMPSGDLNVEHVRGIE